MAITKRTTSKTTRPSEGGAETLTPRKARTGRKSGTGESVTAAAAGAKSAEQKSPAATHKAPSRKAKDTAGASGPVFSAEQHHEEIAREAYYLWQSRGCGHGEAHEDWAKAEALVRERHTSSR